MSRRHRNALSPRADFVARRCYRLTYPGNDSVKGSGLGGSARHEQHLCHSARGGLPPHLPPGLDGFRQVVLDQREVIELRGPDRTVMWGDRREFTWYMRDVRFVQSPLRFNGVEIGDADRRKYEADFIKREAAKGRKKPMVGFIAGVTAPPGRRMGHAGAIISGGKGKAEDKLEAMRSAGITIADSPAAIGTTMSKVLKH